MTRITPLEIMAANKARLQAELDNRSVSVIGLPYYYHVHLHMPCNQRCIMCVPTGRHPNTSLPYEKFLSLFDTIKPYAEHITLIGGEPLLYPQIYAVLDLLSQNPVAVTVNTNATALNEGLSEKLLNLHELHLKCSIDAAFRDTYFRIRGTDVFDKVVKNIKQFTARAKDLDKIKVIPVFVVMKENLGEVLPFIDMFGADPVERIEFHPVRHVADWIVGNKTGWTFSGAEQICESFSQHYNDVMSEAKQKGLGYGLEIEVQPVPEG